ncbi:MAG TPA: outer membrane protein transport protein [Azospira sp.]|nr:outer membrane protein transport protein [Azospira sp.]
MLKTSMKLLPALVLGGLYGTAGASGFQLLEQNASGLGNAYAGSAAVAEDASTIYFNPAGMTKLQDREVSVGLNAIRPSYKFTNQGSTLLGAPATGNNGGDAGDWGYVPNGYMSWALSRDLYVGVGVGAPFGLKTEYDRNWVGRMQSTKFDIKTLNINPSVAYRVNDKVSVGFGLNWQKFDAEYVRQAHPVFGGTATLNAKDSAWGWNAGALFQLSPATRLGVSYRSDIKYKLEGDVALSANLGGARTNVIADLKTPDTFILSLAHNLNDRWELLGDLSWTGWSKIPKLDILTTNGGLVQRLDTEFRDTWRAALGATYKYSDAWKLKMGVAYDQAPVKNAEHRLTSLPDNNRIWLSIGAQFAPSKTSRLDVGYAHLFVKDSQINNNQNPVQGVVKGSYEADANILGVQYSMSF